MFPNCRKFLRIFSIVRLLNSAYSTISDVVRDWLCVTSRMQYSFERDSLAPYFVDSLVYHPKQRVNGVKRQSKRSTSLGEASKLHFYGVTCKLPYLAQGTWGIGH
jgi:hypothetical protein